jgi:hypothetical protein
MLRHSRNIGHDSLNYLLVRTLEDDAYVIEISQNL